MLTRSSGPEILTQAPGVERCGPITSFKGACAFGCEAG